MIARAHVDHGHIEHGHIEHGHIEHGDIEFEQADIETWTPEQPVDVIFSNATLHWLDHHGRLFPRLFDFLRPGGVMAIQMPNNWAEPTHTIPRDVLAGDEWSDPQRQLLITDRVDEPAEYRQWLVDRMQPRSTSGRRPTTKS